MAFLLVCSFCFRSDMCYHLSGNGTYPADITNTAGADDTDKGTRIVFAVSIVFCIAISFLIYIFVANLMQLFVDANEIEIIAEGTRYLRIEGAMYVGIGVLFLWYGYFRGISRPHISLLLTVISLGTCVILSYTLAPYTLLGITAIWCSIPIGWVLADVIELYLYRKK